MFSKIREQPIAKGHYPVWFSYEACYHYLCKAPRSTSTPNTTEFLGLFTAGTMR